jgi:hypothetical protein
VENQYTRGLNTQFASVCWFLFLERREQIRITYLRTYLFTYLRTYLLLLWSRVLLEKLTGLQLVKQFPAFYRTRRFITAFTSAHNLFLSWASSIWPIPPHSTSWRLILIWSYFRPGLPSDLFLSGFPTNTLYTSLLSPIRAIFPTHLILLDRILDIITQLGMYENFVNARRLEKAVSCSVRSVDVTLRYVEMN